MAMYDTKNEDLYQSIELIDSNGNYTITAPPAIFGIPFYESLDPNALIMVRENSGDINKNPSIIKYTFK